MLVLGDDEFRQDPDSDPEELEEFFQECGVFSDEPANTNNANKSLPIIGGDGEEYPERSDEESQQVEKIVEKFLRENDESNKED